MEMVSFSGAYAFASGVEANETEFEYIKEEQKLFRYLSQAGAYSDERIAIAAASRILLSQGKPLTNKGLIDSLLLMLTCCDDVVTGDILRHALEIVVEFTEDDI